MEVEVEEVVSELRRWIAPKFRSWNGRDKAQKAQNKVFSAGSAASVQFTCRVQAWPTTQACKPSAFMRLLCLLTAT
jgi:hypothetical protein